jgi:tetratricopeptide (TPR) repeat protein
VGIEDDATQYKEKSLQLLETAATLCKQWLGPTHPETLDAIYYLAEDQSRGGYEEQAYKNFEFVIKERMRTLGAEHEETLAAKWSMSEMLVYMDGESDEGSVTETMGLPLKQELAEIWDRVYGLAHEGTRDAYSDLGQCYEMLAMMPEALAAFEREALACEACFGLDDEGTADALSRVAGVMEESLERFVDSLPVRRKVLEICKKVLGPGHERTRQAAEALADCMQAAGLPDAGHLDRDIFVSSL